MSEKISLDSSVAFKLQIIFNTDRHNIHSRLCVKFRKDRGFCLDPFSL